MMDMIYAPIRWVTVAILLASANGLFAAPLPAVVSTNQSPVVELRLNDYLQTVLRRNNTLQSQVFQSEAARRKSKAEYGAFEPQLELSAMHEANQRTNSVVQQASQNGQGYFDERNNVYDSGIESLLPTGGKVRLGYTLSDLGNNVNPYGNILSTTNQIWTRQYQTFVGVTFTQPLLQNGGVSVNLAELRLAAADSEIGFQQYRRQLMLTVAQAENAYWNLYFAQEQLRFFDDSVAVAQNVLDDSRQMLKAGQGSDLDVMEAQSGLALRETKRNEVLQNYLEAVGNLQSLAGTVPTPKIIGPDDPAIRVVDAPPETNAIITYADGFNDAVELNPDFLIQKQKMIQEGLRLGVAKNQLLPQLDFKAAYGFNGLGTTPGNSWDMAQSQDFPSWSIGLQLTVPLGGNIKGRNLAKAAKLSLQAAYASLRGVQTEIANHLNSAILKTHAWQQSIQSYQTVVHFNEALLQTEFARLKAGTIEARKVLEVEADLLDARQNLASALMQSQQSVLQVELASGSLLKNLHLEVTHEELKQESAGLTRRNRTTEDALNN
jgi:outer membrane protein TolC